MSQAIFKSQAVLASRCPCREEKTRQTCATSTAELSTPAGKSSRRNSHLSAHSFSSARSLKALTKRQSETWSVTRSPVSTRTATANEMGLASEPSLKVLETLRAADAVCFDVDSTVCRDEGIDELAAYLGKGDEVAAWTHKAMGGGVPFQEALQARLSIMQPTQQSLHEFLKQNPPKLSPGIKEFIQELQRKGKTVYLVSGGFRHMIEPVADLVGVPRGNIYANNLLFKESGDFLGFDATEFTSQAGGKANAIRYLKQEHGYQTMVMMGDGATDLEARQPGGADIFIGYGGVVVRSNIAKQSDWYVTSFEPVFKALTQP